MYFKFCFQLLSNTPSKQYHSSLLPVVNECLCFSLPASIEEFGCWQMLKYLSNCYIKMVSYYFKLHFLSMRLSNLIIYSHFYFFFLFQLLMYFFWFFLLACGNSSYDNQPFGTFVANIFPHIVTCLFLLCLFYSLYQALEKSQIFTYSYWHLLLWLLYLLVQIGVSLSKTLYI